MGRKIKLGPCPLGPHSPVRVRGTAQGSGKYKRGHRPHTGPLPGVSSASVTICLVLSHHVVAPDDNSDPRVYPISRRDEHSGPARPDVILHLIAPLYILSFLPHEDPC